MFVPLIPEIEGRLEGASQVIPLKLYSAIVPVVELVAVKLQNVNQGLSVESIAKLSAAP